MDDEPRSPSLRVRPRDVAPCVLVVGDPNRVGDAAQLLERAEEVGYFREYRTITGFFIGKRITISSHGVGASGANVCFHELINCGARTIIRAGTCGAMLPGIQDGDLIIATGAVREDGTSEHLAPMSYPAISDLEITNTLLEIVRQEGTASPHLGLMLTQAYFYPGMLPSETDVWLPTGLVAGVEMELATLLVMAGLRKVRAGGIFTSDGNLTQQADPESYDPYRKVVEQGKAHMLSIALQALARLQEEIIN